MSAISSRMSCRGAVIEVQLATGLEPFSWTPTLTRKGVNFGPIMVPDPSGWKLVGAVVHQLARMGQASEECRRIC